MRDEMGGVEGMLGEGGSEMGREIGSQVSDRDE